MSEATSDQSPSPECEFVEFQATNPYSGLNDFSYHIPSGELCIKGCLGWVQASALLDEEPVKESLYRAVGKHILMGQYRGAEIARLN